jgi:hypothetical protein
MIADFACTKARADEGFQLSYAKATNKMMVQKK